MAIHIDIYTRLHDREIRKDTDKLSKDFERAGLDAGSRYSDNLSKGIGRSAPKVERAMGRLADASAKARIEQKKHDDMMNKGESNRRALIVQSDKLRAALHREAAAYKEVAQAQRKANDELRSTQDVARTTVGGLNRLGGATRGVGRGLGTLAAVPVLAFMDDLAHVAFTASKSLLLIPAAATAAGVGMGTLALATSGFGDAIKDIRDPEKFAEGLAGISPRAQQAALSLQALLPEFDKLKNATQDAFFSGLGGRGGIFEQLSSQYLPSIQALTTDVATSFNEMFRGISTQLMTPETQTQIQNIMGNIGDAFRELLPGAQSLIQAFLDISEAGSDFLPGLARDAADLAAEFANFIREARESGQLKVWIQEGIDAVGALATGIIDLGEIIYSIFQEDGKTSIESFKESVETVRDTVALLKGDFSGLGESIKNDFANVARGGFEPLKESLTDLLNFFIDNINNFTQQTENLVNTVADLFPGGGAKHIDLPEIGRRTYTPPPGWTNAYGPPPTPSTGGREPGWGGPPVRADRHPSRPGPTGDRPVPAPPVKPGDKPPLNFPTDQWSLDQIPLGQFPGAPGGMGPMSQIPMAGVSAGGAYGLPKGTDIRQGAGGFPDWVYQIGEAFGVTASTYAGHQEGSGQNKGIDWWGSTENMQKFADYLAQTGVMEQVIFSNPQTGQKTGVADGQMVGPGTSQPGYYAANWAGHEEHVHTRQSSPIPFPGMGPMSTAGPTGMGMGTPHGGAGPGYFEIDQQDIFDAESRVMSDRNSVEEARRRVLELEADTNSSQDDLYRARSNVVERERALQSSMQDLAEAQQGTYKELETSNKSHTDSIQQFGAKLDEDFGISKGLPGIAENITKFLANLAMAPVLGALAGVTGAYGTAGPNTGLLGMLSTRQDAFGNTFPNIMGQYPGMQQGGGTAQMGQYPTGGTGGGGGGVSIGMGPTGQMQPFGPPPGPSGMQPPWSADWNAMAQKEASSDWGADTGNGYSGGLQFAPSTWNQYGGQQYAPQANQATPYQQAMIGENTLAGQGPGAWPNTFTPGSSGPTKPWAPGALPGGPQALPGGPGVGSLAGVPFSGPGTPMPGRAPGEGLNLPKSEGIGFGGGLIGFAQSLPGMAAQAGGGMFPGGGAAGAAIAGAAQIGIDQMNLAIAYGAKVAGIGVQGLMETFLPNESPLADVQGGWLGRIGGAIAGIRPVAANLAGAFTQQGMEQQTGESPPPLTPEQAAAKTAEEQGKQQGSAVEQGPINITYNNNNATEDRAGADLTHHLSNMRQGPTR